MSQIRKEYYTIQAPVPFYFLLHLRGLSRNPGYLWYRNILPYFEATSDHPSLLLPKSPASSTVCDVSGCAVTQTTLSFVGKKIRRYCHVHKEMQVSLII